MIEGIVGLPGQGKTLFATVLMEEAASAGRRVISNFPSNFSEEGLWHDMFQADNSLCAIDEAQMWFGAREWTKTTKLELGMFQQHRKNGLDVLWIAQHENRVDVALREITAFIWRVRKFGDFILASKFTPDDRKNCLQRRLIHAPKYYNKYDTLKIIGDREGEGAHRGKSTALAGDVRDGQSRIINGVLFLRVELFGGRVIWRRPKDVELESVLDYEFKFNFENPKTAKADVLRLAKLHRMIQKASNGRI